MSVNYFTQIYSFFAQAEKLKSELRHSWTSSGRRESVAEHTWMATLIAMTIIKKVNIPLDELKVLKMLILHDLVEVVVGDIPSHEVSERMNQKHENEVKAIQEITKNLDQVGEEMRNLWMEFEDCQTNEAKFAYAIDKYECLVQHDLANISTWDDADYRYTFVDRQDTPFDFDPFMRELKNALDHITYDKVNRDGTPNKIPVENMQLFQSHQKDK